MCFFQEVIVLAKVLAAEVNYGYQESFSRKPGRTGSFPKDLMLQHPRGFGGNGHMTTSPVTQSHSQSS